MGDGYSLSEIATWVGGRLRGEGGVRILGVGGIDDARGDQITWVAEERYAVRLAASGAGAVVVAADFGETPMPAILVENPEEAMAVILGRFAPPVPRPAPGVHPSAVVASSATLGEGVAVGPHAVIGEHAVIGDATVLHAQVFIGAQARIGRQCELWPGVVVRERCTLGDRVVIHPNTTIGADGFGYRFTEGRHQKIPQIGTVDIEDDVEIGANCAVDRAKFGVTRIGRGAKIDNLVQIGHNVRVGAGCLIVAQCGLAGSARLGRGVVLGGQVGVRDHVTIGDGTLVAACASVSKDLPPGGRFVGSPAVDAKEFVRERASIHRVPRLTEQVKSLIKRVEQLESAADHSEPG